MSFLSLKLPDVTKKHQNYSKGRTLANNLIFIIWAVFGGFILHFLLANYLTVLLRPSYEKPVDSIEDIIKRDLTVFMYPGSEIFREYFAAFSDPNYQEIARKLVITNTDEEYMDMVRKVTSTGLFVDIGAFPDSCCTTVEEYKYWYRSSEIIAGDNPYTVHLENKKWPLKKVLLKLKKLFSSDSELKKG